MPTLRVAALSPVVLLVVVLEVVSDGVVVLLVDVDAVEVEVVIDVVVDDDGLVEVEPPRLPAMGFCLLAGGKPTSLDTSLLLIVCIGQCVVVGPNQRTLLMYTVSQPCPTIHSYIAQDH